MSKYARDLPLFDLLRIGKSDRILSIGKFIQRAKAFQQIKVRDVWENKKRWENICSNQTYKPIMWDCENSATLEGCQDKIHFASSRNCHMADIRPSFNTLKEIRVWKNCPCAFLNRNMLSQNSSSGCSIRLSAKSLE